VKTFIVKIANKDFIGNAESPEEAVLYAIAREGMIADKYVVYDHDLNCFEIQYAALRSKETPSEQIQPELSPNTAG
jgi:hypothetical protein